MVKGNNIVYYHNKKNKKQGNKATLGDKRASQIA